MFSIWGLALLCLLSSPDAISGAESVAVERHASYDLTTGERISSVLDESTIAARLIVFDSADGNVRHSIELNPPDWGAPVGFLSNLAEDHVYGCFVVADFERAADAECSDTVFLTPDELRHRLAIDADEAIFAHENQVVTSKETPAHNYPNPFNPRQEATTIVFEPVESGPIVMSIYDLFGHLVYEKTIPDADDLSWDGRNGRNELVASGGYICILQMDGEVVSRHKIAVIK